MDYYLTGEYWRYAAKVDEISGRTPYPLYDLGAGRIKRGPEGLARPGSILPRLWVQQTAKNLMSSEVAQKIPWVIVCYTETDPNTHYTTITYLNWQPGVSIPDGGNTYSTPSWDDVYGGLIEEKLGLNANAVIGAWVSPMSASESDVYTHGSYAAYEYYNSGSTVTAVFDMNNHVQTDDLIKYVFEDTTGTEMFTAPWGLQFRYIIEQIDVGSSGANVMFYLAGKAEYDAAAGDMSKLAYASEGRLFSFPLPALPVTENAWQSYNYTGERAYDIEMREIQKNQNAINGIAGVGTSAIGGAIAGSMVLPGPGTIAGAVAGIATGAISTATNYVTSGHYDNRTQEAVDKLTSSQTAAMIVTARGRRGIEPFGKSGETFGWCVIKMQADPLSAADIYADQSELGYVTDAYRTDCATVVAMGGGLRIEGLEVKGDIPPEGRAYIAALFARGVHLDLIQ